MPEPTGDDRFEARVLGGNASREIGRNPANAPPQLAEIDEFFAQSQHAPARRPEVAAGNSQQRGLAAAVRARAPPNAHRARSASRRR